MDAILAERQHAAQRQIFEIAIRVQLQRDGIEGFGGDERMWIEALHVQVDTPRVARGLRPCRRDGAGETNLDRKIERSVELESIARAGGSQRAGPLVLARTPAKVRLQVLKLWRA